VLAIDASDLENPMSHDESLQKAVLAQLHWEPSVEAGHIGVTADDGIVTLTGHVTSFAEKHAAEAATRLVKGVTGVVEAIEVRLAFDFQRDDDVIAAAAVDRLAWDVSVPRDAVKVSVEKAWVTLTGEVLWHYQKEAAEQDLRRLYGVVGVSNQITIRPRVNVSDISDNIMHAMHRSWFFDPKTIDVSANLGRVILTGTARSPHDRNVAATTAWAAPGVTDVLNEIELV
jgi:osmotically-inducible protein OsmY